MAKPAERWIVHRFGGSRLAGADYYHRVASIVEELTEKRVAPLIGGTLTPPPALAQLLGRPVRRAKIAANLDALCALLVAA